MAHNSSAKKKVETRINKNNSKEVIKKEIKGENDNKKIIIIALILALVIGIVVYVNVGKSNDVDNDNKSSNVEENITNEDKEEIKNEEENKEENKVQNTTNNISNTINNFDDEKVEQTVVEEEKQEELENNDVVEEVTKYYSITFNTNGGDNIDKQILEDNEVSESVIPVKQGWSFAGWFTDEELTNEFVFGDKIEEDIVLNAKWVKILRFVSEDTVVKMLPVADGEEIVLPTIEELGDLIDSENEEATWIFNGLDEFDEEYTLEVLNNMVFDSTELRSNQAIIELDMDKLLKFDLEFYLDEESDEPIYTLKVVEGREIGFDLVNESLKEIELPESYGWYYRNIFGLKVNFAKDKKANHNITKLYLDGTYKITYVEKQEDEEGNTNEVILKEENIVKDSTIEKDDILLPNEKEGYEFNGWLLEQEESDKDVYLDEELIINEDKTFIADYKEINAREEEVNVIKSDEVEEEIKQEQEVEEILEEAE